MDRDERQIDADELLANFAGNPKTITRRNRSKPYSYPRDLVSLTGDSLIVQSHRKTRANPKEWTHKTEQSRESRHTSHNHYRYLGSLFSIQPAGAIWTFNNEFHPPNIPVRRRPRFHPSSCAAGRFYWPTDLTFLIPWQSSTSRVHGAVVSTLPEYRPQP